MIEEIRVRKEIVERCKAEMLGPGSEDIGVPIENEVISDSPIERYALGILFPKNTCHNTNEGEKDIEVNDTSQGELEFEDEIEKAIIKGINTESKVSSYTDDGMQEQIMMTNQQLPSALGITFFSRGKIDYLNIRISCAKYKESSYSDCMVRVKNAKNIDKYYLDEFIYLESNVMKLKKNITKKDVLDLVSGREIQTERPDLVSALYKLCDLCTVNKYNRGYARNPFLKNKIFSVPLYDEYNTIYINEDGNLSKDGGILKLSVLKREYDNNVFSYTVVLVNEQTGGRDYKKCIFQPEIKIDTEDNDITLIEHSYMSKKGIGIVSNEDLVYELLYRNKNSYAIGHGVATGQVVDDKNGKGIIYSDFFPSFEVPQLEFNLRKLENSENILSMYELSDLSDSTQEEKVKLLYDFSNAYENWINEIKLSINNIEPIFKNVAEEQIEKCKNTLNRIRRGINEISSDINAYNAFLLMNRAMLMQREHSKLNGSEFDRFPEDSDFPTFDYLKVEKKNASWRAFQLAFILMNIEGINNPNCEDRDIVDLIWIPTGGGKTEAYLGITGYTIFLRRLKDPIKGGGTAIIMRYTLRLLAAQQFIRASILICACEKIRREIKTLNLGKTEISIGLWIGKNPTPNKNETAKKLYKKLVASTNSKYELYCLKKNYNKFQVLKCPWCGTKLEMEYIDGKKKGMWGYNYDKKKIIFCPDMRCEFHKKLPIQVVDEELYKEPPTLLFGTVDKFATLPWEGDVANLFALEKGSSNKQPELIIQDELHLISGPLGSMVGLYETAVDAMCTNITSNCSIRPKIIASTATIKRASEQCKMLFNRSVSQFPPSGINIEDSFFIREIPVNVKPGRLYVGLMPSGKTATTTQVRLYTSILESVKFIDTKPEVLDKYWTLVGYFNSIRELGKTSNLVKNDIASNNIRYMKRLLKANDIRYVSFPEELTSRVESIEIVKILKELENNYTGETKDNNTRPIDVLLASNMISVGVDVSRLDLMVVSGQPKQTSEYIQASSRVGRKYPGVVFTLYNNSKTRDRSHYELFYPYHQTFYKYVEPTSITPFSEQARERGLHAVLISMVRHLLKLTNDEEANNFHENMNKLDLIIDFILNRTKELDQSDIQDVAIETQKEVKEIIEKWSNKVKTAVGDGKICYKSTKYNKNLLIPFLEENINNAFPTMQSLRNVDSEAGVEIIVFGDDNND